jgi:hypothetical protein
MGAMSPLHALALALVTLAAAALPGAPSDVARAPQSAAPPARTAAAPTLRPAGSALGGSWSEAQVRRHAAIFDLVVVGASARAERVRLFRAARPGIVVLAYIAGFDVHEDQALFGWIRDRHPDWWLRDAAGRPLRTYRDPRRWALDCGRADVRAFFADSARRRREAIGADGVFEDNVLPSWDYRNLARGAARLERYATVEEWRAALERYLEAIEQAVAPAVLGANQVVPWTRHARIVAVEELPRDGARWEEMLRGFEALARDTTRVPYLQHTLQGPEDPARAFVTASYLMVVRPGAFIGFRWRGPRDSVRWLPEYGLALGPPLDAARVEGGIWWRDFERARVLVNPTGRDLPAPWPAWSGGGPPLPARRAGIAWRPGVSHGPLPYWVER